MASFFDRLRRLSGSAEPNSPTSDIGASSPRVNVWSATFDPGHNKNLKGGRSYYDTGDDGKTVWDHCLESEKSKPETEDLHKTTFQAIGGNKDAISGDDLRKMLAPERVESLMKAFDKNGDGKIDFNEFLSALRG